MTAIAIGVACVSSVFSTIGGYFFVQGENERKRIKDIEENVKNIAALVIYPECNYKGDPVLTFDLALDGESSKIDMSKMSEGKSFILPTGIKADMYAKANQQGVKLPYNGPTYNRCTTIISLNAESIPSI